MTAVFASILVALDGSRTAARGLGCAAWLSGRLGVRLHVLSATPEVRPAPEALRRLGVAREHWGLITLHQAPAYPAEAILSAVAQHGVGLVVITARGEGGEAAPGAGPGRLVGRVARAVMEESPVPVLLLPPGYRERLPWRRVLVPLSGEVDAGPALALALRLAEALDLQVCAAHVAGGGGGAGLEARARYADALHHEYRQQLDELVRQHLPGRDPAELRRIEDVVLCCGDVADELRDTIARQGVSLLVASWHGRFHRGRARVLKQLLRTLTVPVLLVRAAPRAPFRLKVGEELE